MKSKLIIILVVLLACVFAIGSVFYAAGATVDKATKGAWMGKYGADGYLMVGATSSVPSYATVSWAANYAEYTWAASTSAPEALEYYINETQKSGRVSAKYVVGSTVMTINLTLGDSEHKVSLYCLDYQNEGRTQRIQVVNKDSGSVIDSYDLSAFSTGAYVTWTLSGNVTINISRIGGNNAVLNAIFFDTDVPATEPPATTQAPVETTQAPVETTQAPVETTQASVETTQAPVETTQAPVETTQAPAETTQAPVETTQAPVETTQAPVETTTPAQTTQAPADTTAPAAGTTSVPTDSANPGVPETGDNSILFLLIISGIALSGVLALNYKQKALKK